MIILLRCVDFLAAGLSFWPNFILPVKHRSLLVVGADPNTRGLHAPIPVQESCASNLPRQAQQGYGETSAQSYHDPGVTLPSLSESFRCHFHAAAVDKSAKSLHRMLAPHGNPSTENFFGIVRALQKKTRVKLSVTAKAA
jgi:hypothetical protein